MKKDTVYWGLNAIIFAFLLFIIIGGVVKNNSLSVNLNYTNAVITDFRSGPRLSNYFDYDFTIDGKRYQGSGEYYPKKESLSIGDSILIVYDGTNPDNNKPYRDFR